MLRYFLIPAFLLALFSRPAFAADKSSGDDGAAVHAGGLSCFSIRPPDEPTRPAGPRVWALYRSCDAICAAKGAACTAATSNYNPPIACDSAEYNPASTLCRCCAAGR